MTISNEGLRDVLKDYQELQKPNPHQDVEDRLATHINALKNRHYSDFNANAGNLTVTSDSDKQTCYIKRAIQQEDSTKYQMTIIKCNKDTPSEETHGFYIKMNNVSDDVEINTSGLQVEG